MKFEVTEEERLFREEVRDWLRANTPKQGRPPEADRRCKAHAVAGMPAAMELALACSPRLIGIRQCARDDD